MRFSARIGLATFLIVLVGCQASTAPQTPMTAEEKKAMDAAIISGSVAASQSSNIGSNTQQNMDMTGHP